MGSAVFTATPSQLGATTYTRSSVYRWWKSTHLRPDSVGWYRHTQIINLCNRENATTTQNRFAELETSF